MPGRVALRDPLATVLLMQKGRQLGGGASSYNLGVMYHLICELLVQQKDRTRYT